MELQGRYIGSEGNRKASVFIKKQLNKSNYEVEEQFFVVDNVQCSNVIGRRSTGKDSVILFVAHYDHIAPKSDLSREVNEKMKTKIHPGADDNASGVASLLWLSKKAIKYDKYDFTFLFTSAHEKGLYGANEYVKELDDNIKYVVNLDMVGRMNFDNEVFYTSNFGKIKPCNEISFIDISFKSLSNDASVFMKKGFKTINLTTGIHKDYHKSTDTSEKVNIKGMKLICNYILEKIIKDA